MKNLKADKDSSNNILMFSLALSPSGSVVVGRYTAPGMSPSSALPDDEIAA
ncbi:MAG: hypothetical protein LBL35_01280 [Clostridiales bacterium]|nr:hypothetical protein [Clostridiales bacterium]